MDGETLKIRENGELHDFEFKKKPVYEFFKRATDIVCSGLAIVVLSPLLAAVATAVKSDKGPALFSQTRIGRDGIPFKMYKFRSMCVDAEAKKAELQSKNEADGPVFKMENDPRVTPVGKIIRRTSLDELPQLFNIFKGDMSIVGPRPPLENEVEEYTSYDIQRLKVKPGLTCVWQCSGRSNVGFREWMDMDMEYIKNRNYFYDWFIIFKTVPAVLRSEGAK